MPIGDLLASITGEPSPAGTGPSTALPKHKADDAVRNPLNKIQKTGLPTANSSRPISLKPVDVVSSKSKTGPIVPKPSVQNSAASAFNNGQPTPPAEPAKPPKKGSYAEIMARAKAAQGLNQVGKIQHKKIEKPPSKRELALMKAQKSQRLEKAFGPTSKFREDGQTALRDGKNGARESNGKAVTKFGPPHEPEKKVKKAALATTGYSGTARPKLGSGRGSPKPSASTSRNDHGPDRYRDERYGSSKRYTYVSEEDEEEEDHYSDASSDMEAAAFEVDEEEEMATRIARQEDAEALAEENRLKREKEERKRRMAAMAKAAKPRSY